MTVICRHQYVLNIVAGNKLINCIAESLWGSIILIQQVKSSQCW